MGAHDGAPGLWIHDDKYRSTCWQLIVWVGNTMKGPSLLFDELAGALLAAQDKEDKVRQTR